MMGEPIWSRQFAWNIVRSLGWTTFEAAGQSVSDREVETLVEQLTEDFRYLPGQQVNWAEDLAQFLRARELGETPAELPCGWLPAKLREVRDYVAFLRTRYGRSQPADESDEWTDEDREDAAQATWRRVDEEDPYPWQEEADNAPDRPTG